MFIKEDQELLSELGSDFGDELVGLKEIADLLGLSASTAAQLRTTRNRDAGFPTGLHASGRTIVHPLSELLDWLGSSRFGDELRLDPVEIWRWRLQRSAERAATARHRPGVRNLVAGLALARSSEAFADLFEAAIPAISLIVERARFMPVPPARTLGTNVIDPPMDLDPNAMSTLLGGIVRPDQGPLMTAIVRDVDGLWRASTSGGDPILYPLHIDRVLLAIAPESSTRPNRASPALGYLLAVMLDTQPGDLVYEPTCGECEALLRVALLQRETAPGPGVIVVGRDTDGDALRIGRARLSLHGVTSSLGTPGFNSRGELESDPVGADRMLVDPGPSDEDWLPKWLGRVDRHLSSTGRAVLAVSINALDTRWISKLPPTRLVIVPRAVAHTGSEPTVLWVHDRAGSPSRCQVIDLRIGARTLDAHERVAAFTRRVAHSRPSAIAASLTAQRSLNAVLPDDPQVSSLTHDELATRLRGIQDGPLMSETQADVIAENRRWALRLARELERLITTAGGPTAPGLDDAPDDSPGGVLASITSDEARRVVRRLADSFDDETTSRRGRPRKRP